MRVVKYLIDTIKEIAPILFALWVGQQFIWLMWAAFGN